MGPTHRLVAGFQDQHVEVDCDTDWLAAELRARLGHLVVQPPRDARTLMRLRVTELVPTWLEICASTGQCERGSLTNIAYYARKWITAAFVAAEPDFLWLHAAAASRNGSAVLLSGHAGAGKSTLLVQLLARSWSLLADDAVAVRPDGGQALPLPFNPEMRAARQLDEEWQRFLQQPKALVPVRVEQIASTPAAVATIVFPEYSAAIERATLTQLSVVSTAEAVAAQCLPCGDCTAAILQKVFTLTRHIPCYRLHYRDAADGARALAESSHLNMSR